MYAKPKGYKQVDAGGAIDEAERDNTERPQQNCRPHIRGVNDAEIDSEQKED